MRKLLISLSLMVLVASMVLAITQVGSLIVTVMSQEGQLLPGASVMIKSTEMIGTRTQATGSNGKTTFRNLPPGDYTVSVNMDKFAPALRKGVQIVIAKTSKINIELTLGPADEIITVVASSPIIDTSSHALSQEFNFDNNINHMPNDRHYNDIIGAAAGSRDQNNPSVFGSGSYDNLYMVDGIATVDTRVQTWSEQFNVDTIQDVSVQSAGVSAEYGQFQGAVLNLVTKSGSNNFSGLVRLEMQRIGWNDLHEVYNRAGGRDTDDWYYSGGGPLWPDLIWWYVGYNEFGSTRTATRYTDPTNLDVTEELISPYIGHALNFKITAQPTEDFRILFTYLESPVDIENVGGYYDSDRFQTSAEYHQSQGSTESFIANASYIINEDTFVEARYSKRRGGIEIFPQFAIAGIAVDAGTEYSYYSNDDWYWGGTVQVEFNSLRNSDTYGIAYNWLLNTESFGNHDIKIGFDYNDLWSQTVDHQWGEQGYALIDNQTGYAFSNWQAAGPLEQHLYFNRLPMAEEHSIFYSMFIQDSIEVNDNLTLNIGVRFDPNTMDNNQDESIVDFGIFDAIQPRLGLTYDFGDGLSARASYSVFYDQTWQYMIDDFNVFPTPQEERVYLWQAGAWAYSYSSYKGQAVSPHSIDADFSMQYSDDFTVGVDYQVNADLAVSLTGVMRTYNNLQVGEDIDWDGVYNWTNVELPDHGLTYKEYKAAILKITKRPTSDNLYLQLTATMQDQENIFTHETDSAGFWSYYQDPSTTNGYEDHWWGDPGFESIALRGQATYFFLNGWYVGVDAQWDNGRKPTSYNVIYYDGWYPNYSYPNGKADMDRIDAYSQVNLQVGIESTIEFPFDVPFTDNDLLFGIYAEINDLFDFEGVLEVGQRIGSAGFGQPTDYSGARTYQLGFRLEL